MHEDRMVDQVFERDMPDEEPELELEDDETVEECEKAIENGNCPDHCDQCPIGQRWLSAVPDENRERAEQEHRAGVGAGEVRIA